MQVLRIIFKLLLRGVKSKFRIQMKTSIFKFRLKWKFWRSYLNICSYLCFNLKVYIIRVSSSNWNTSVLKIILKWLPRGYNLNTKREIQIQKFRWKFQCSGWKSWTSHFNIYSNSRFNPQVYQISNSNSYSEDQIQIIVKNLQFKSN